MIDLHYSNVINLSSQGYILFFTLSSYNGRNEYDCYSINDTSTIYVPKSNICQNSFTHELLHILLRQKNVFVGSALKLSIDSTPSLKRIYSDGLLEHTGNCLEHIKILPIYLELGFNKEKFILDYHINKCTENEISQIKKRLKVGLNYNRIAIDAFVGKFISIVACPNDSFPYEERMSDLRNISEDLFDINLEFVENWKSLDIDIDDPIERNYNDIVFEYCDAMELWSKKKRII